MVKPACASARLQRRVVAKPSLQALRRLTTAAFGTLMALEPGIATLVGALLLAQIPGVVQVVGVALVVVAGVGAERSGHREPGPPDVIGEGTA